jgi:hypothetical protein
LRISSSLAVPVASASRVAASTNSRPSVSTAERTRTNLRSASSPTPNLRRSLLAAAPFGHAVSGTPDVLAAQMPSISKELADAITGLAARFAQLMRCDTVRVILEGITGNACRKVHADYTDLRLICTLEGTGTDYTLGDDPEGSLLSIPTGAEALFKGREFGAGHAACLHRSPPIEGTGASRLVLVIDTTQRHLRD